MMKEFPKSRECYSQALQILEQVPDEILTYKILVHIGASFYYEGKLKTALDDFNKIPPLVFKSKDKFSENNVLGYEGFILYKFGEYKTGCALVKEALETTREIKDKLFEEYLKKTFQK